MDEKPDKPLTPEEQKHVEEALMEFTIAKPVTKQDIRALAVLSLLLQAKEVEQKDKLEIVRHLLAWYRAECYTILIEGMLHTIEKAPLDFNIVAAISLQESTGRAPDSWNKLMKALGKVEPRLAKALAERDLREQPTQGNA